MKKFVLVIILAASTLRNYAQDDRIEGVKRDFISKELELTSQEADAFFPLYNEFSQKRREAMRSRRQELRSASSEAGAINKLMDKEQDIVDIKKEYYDKFSKVIPERKVLKLQEAESKFKMMLLQKIK